MPGIPSNVCRIVLEGHLGVTEIFQTSFWYQGDTPLSSSDANNLAAEVVTQLTGPSLTTLKGMLRTPDGYDEVRVYSYPTGGPHATYIGSAPITGGAGTSAINQCNQVCMVATLNTDKAGSSYRGRMYLPATGVQLSNSDALVSPTASGIAGAVADFFQAMNGLGTDNHVVVVSQLLEHAESVTAVSVDDRPDIQRRRANKVLGTRYAVSV